MSSDISDVIAAPAYIGFVPAGCLPPAPLAPHRGSPATPAAPPRAPSLNAGDVSHLRTLKSHFKNLNRLPGCSVSPGLARIDAALCGKTSSASAMIST